MSQEIPRTTISINKASKVEGKMTVAKAVDIEKSPTEVIIEGVVQLPEYFEEINHLETDKLKIDNVMVYREAFGTAEDDITYNFIAGDLHVK